MTTPEPAYAGAPLDPAGAAASTAAPAVRRAGVVVAWSGMVALVAASVVAAIVAGMSLDEWLSSYTASNLVVGVALAASGLFIAWFRPRHPVGVLMAVAGMGHLVSAAVAPIATLGLDQGWPEWTTRTLTTVYLGAWTLGLPALFMLALLYYPDGRLLSRRWRWAAVYFTVAIAWVLVSTVVGPFEAIPGEPGSMSILAIAGLDPQTLDAVGLVVGFAVLPIAVASLIVRFVRGDARTRRQVMWLMLAILAIAVFNLQRFVTGDGPIVLLFSTVFVPIAIAIAIVREGLLDIRVVLSRTLVYGSVIAVVVALYAGLVAALTLVVPADADRTVAVVAAVLVALLFNPLRLLAQRGIGRLFYGTRDDPATTAGRVGAAISADTLDEVLHELRQALRMPRIAVHAGGRVVAADGVDPADAAHDSLPLGRDAVLVVTLRAGEVRLHEADRRTLELLTPSLALVLREQRLVAELRIARAQTAEARETERKALHRDLHDGLGPTLTSAALHVDAARNLVPDEPARADSMLTQARDDLGEALAEVRRVVYGLRPVALDGDGLVGALREQAGHLAGLPVTLEIGPLPEISPAVELAAYRVVVEAIANANRHSTASRVVVALSARSGTLEAVVRDDGTPDAGFSPGVGIRSLTERVEELGGTVEVGPSPGGWTVAARLPLPA
ncbi:histidine kinase [Microbacterium sp. ProA8]|uniref:sensor histidine kinase n=1 Tax=Microbacterium chionoecetis TaxID=3153754 RepID=UPI0032664FED